MAQRPTLPKLADSSNHRFQTPSKQINEGDDLSFFFASQAYSDLSIWLLQLNLAMFPIRNGDGTIKDSTLVSSDPEEHSPAVAALRTLHAALSSLIDQAPPDTGPRRFGNVAFRTWYHLAEESAPKLLDNFLDGLPDFQCRHREELRQELQAYLLGSFGSAQRLDYGTGHELSYLAFLGCLWKLDIFPPNSERSIVTGLIHPYLILTRRLILLYSLEPAGSHGVWGLDDHSFLPYIFGSAQLGPPIHPSSTLKAPTEGSRPSAPAPSTVTDKKLVRDLAEGNLYFSAIQFIYDVKRGPFWEHSPILYDISGLKDGWGKINKGMLKMYAAEVLGKFPVVQHFPFGSLFCWERDPAAPGVAGATSVHQREQAGVPKQSNMTETEGGPAAGGAGTKAPWAKQGSGAVRGTLQMQASTGVPTTRTPWAAPGARTPQPPSGIGMPSTTAPWASGARPPKPTSGTSVPATAAPWSGSTATNERSPSTTAPWDSWGAPR